jgi:hypothetical protein
VLERFSLGGFVSRERFAENPDESNDFATVSGRAYVLVQDWGKDRWEFASDVRDKNDFFDKLDAERLKLTNRNQLQLRQFSFRRPNYTGRWLPQIGRFAVPESGSVFVDGAQLGVHFSPAWT